MDIASWEEPVAQLSNENPLSTNEGATVASPNEEAHLLLELDQRALADTGAARDLIAKWRVPHNSQAVGRAEGVTFSTANGPYFADKVVHLILPPLGDAPGMAYVMENCPTVLSVGKTLHERGLFLHMDC